MLPEKKLLKVSKRKTGSGHTGSAIQIPFAWAKDMEIDSTLTVIASYNPYKKSILLLKSDRRKTPFSPKAVEKNFDFDETDFDIDIKDFQDTPEDFS